MQATDAVGTPEGYSSVASNDLPGAIALIWSGVARSAGSQGAANATYWPTTRSAVDATRIVTARAPVV